MKDMISCCGADCGSCGLHGSVCTGCSEACGRVFHAPPGEACPIYACCVTKKGFASCAACRDLPCEIIMGTKDPHMTEEEFLASVGERVRRLRGQ